MKIDHLSSSEKIELAQHLWDCVHQEMSSCSISEEQKASLDARLTAFAQDDDEGIEWRQLKDKLLENGL